MAEPKTAQSQPYRVQKVLVIVKGTDVQVRELTVAPGEEVPWHFHTKVTDWCYCLEGVINAETRQPSVPGQASAQRLLPGQSCRIDPGTEHRITNGGDTVCRYLLVQSGEYDFNKIDSRTARAVPE